jgi:hypothetical protein
MPIYRTTNRFRDNKTDLGGTARQSTAGPTGMHDDGRLRRPHTVSHGEVELRRPRHPVSGREHSASP